VLLVNQSGEVTESSTANLVVRIQGGLFTPPVNAGLLPGTYRQELLERGLLIERTLKPDDIFKSDAVFLINSVRGWTRIKVHRPGGGIR